METLITTIRAALADDASAQTRQAGAAACRTILAALDAAPGTTLALNATATARTRSRRAPRCHQPMGRAATGSRAR